jgi:hypothetical protein
LKADFWFQNQSNNLKNDNSFFERLKYVQYLRMPGGQKIQTNQGQNCQRQIQTKEKITLFSS